MLYLRLRIFAVVAIVLPDAAMSIVVKCRPAHSTDHFRTQRSRIDMMINFSHAQLYVKARVTRVLRDMLAAQRNLLGNKALLMQ